jgi:hypothetical protein
VLILVNDNQNALDEDIQIIRSIEENNELFTFVNTDKLQLQIKKQVLLFEVFGHHESRCNDDKIKISQTLNAAA